MPKVKYNFLNDYSNLPRFDVNFTVKNLITRTEVVTATYSGSTQDIAADAFTGEFGKLLIEPDFENADRLISNNNSLALLSINLLNFFLILVLIIVILSFIFLRGLIRPLNQLTKLTFLERDKLKNTIKIFFYIIINT